MNESFWVNRPGDLFLETNFIPCKNCSLDRNLNRLTKFVIIISIIISAVRKSVLPLYLGLFATILIVLFYFLCSSKMNTRRNEGFMQVPIGPYGNTQTGLLYSPDNPTFVKNYSDASNKVSMFNQPQFAYGNGPMLYRLENNQVNNKTYPSLRSPTENNPFMNVMPIDYDATPIYKDYPRYENAIDPSKKQLEIRDSVETNFENKLWQNEESRLFERLNSQRQFISQPVGSVPNKQDEFAAWLYGNQYVCKQGSVWDKYGLKYTDDGLLCNGFNAAAPTNHGLLDNNLMSSVQK